MQNQVEFLKEVLTLNNKPLKDLKEKYQKLYGPKEAVPANRTVLIKRILFKLQEQEHGGLSKAAKYKADELRKKHEPVNNKSAKARKAPVPGPRARPWVTVLPPSSVRTTPRSGFGPQTWPSAATNAVSAWRGSTAIRPMWRVSTRPQ